MENQEKNEAVARHEGCGCGCSESASQEVQNAEKVREEVERRSYLPAVDILDAGSETLLRIDLPGVKESDVDIAVEKNILTVKASQSSQSHEGRKLIYAEYGVGTYQRSFSLSDEINRDGIAASLKDGVLEVKLPKSAPVSKKIAVTVS